MTKQKGYGKCDMLETRLVRGYYDDILFVRASCHDRPFDSKIGKDNYCPVCGMENVLGSHYRKRERGYDVVEYEWDDNEDGTSFRCCRCGESTIMYDGEPPFYCPRCGVGFTAYRQMGVTYPFDDLGNVDYDHGKCEVKRHAR